MQLELSVKETKQVLESFEASDWMEAVKHVEEHKQKFLDLGHQDLAITDHSTKSVCYWKLEQEPRPSLLADKIHKSYKRG